MPRHVTSGHAMPCQVTSCHVTYLTLRSSRMSMRAYVARRPDDAAVFSSRSNMARCAGEKSAPSSAGGSSSGACTACDEEHDDC